ncbi:MAG: DUF4286 family protein [Cytophagaceae bacterium]|jgi:hypothetical protein|nr:DUF4286 family protein [Cytophagaceae bacterium]
MWIYSVTISIDESIHEAWVSRINKDWLPLLQQHPSIHNFRFLRMLSDEHNGGITYSLQVEVMGETEATAFEADFDVQLMNPLYKEFEKKFMEFRTLLAVLISKK